jgi:endonuclease G
MISKILLAGTLYLASISTALAAADYRCDQIVKKQAYQACYNYELKATLFTIHRMRAVDLKKQGYPRDHIKFYEEQDIPQKYRATLADWRGSGFDRSHLVANDDMNHNIRNQKETFSLVCQSMHYPSVNQQAIGAIEKLLRRLTISNGTAIIYSGNIFDRINPKRVGPGLVAVPKATYKVAYFPKKGTKIAFLVENTEGKKSTKASDFRVSVDDLEKQVGFKFQF